MTINYIKEPLLQLGKGKSICPRSGIHTHYPYDVNLEDRPEKIRLGLIGIGESIEKIKIWLTKTSSFISGKETKLPNLFPSFCGFDEGMGFKSKVVYPTGYIRQILNTEFNDALKIELLSERLQSLIQLYLTEIEFLSQNKRPDVILCVLPETSISAIWELTSVAKSKQKKKDDKSNLKDGKSDSQIELEQNFRRELKAKAMEYNIPIQIVRDRIATPKRDMQDEATIAWNFYTALYYKAGGIPWALERNTSDVNCFAGISFYKSRDGNVTETSVAQIFNELGKGVILRGEPIKISKNDRTPHLSEEQAFSLLSQALDEYYKAIKTSPKRLVLHKTSNFNDAEIFGFRDAAKKYNIHIVDMVTIQEYTDLKLYRNGNYPTLRGTMLSLDSSNHLLYTKGYVPHYETYPGSYIPRALLVKTFQAETSPNQICEEILKLTKLNWNNTQFDGKLPITISCARNVGEVLKYLEKDKMAQLKYSFYM